MIEAREPSLDHRDFVYKGKADGNEGRHRQIRFASV